MLEHYSKNTTTQWAFDALLGFLIDKVILPPQPNLWIALFEPASVRPTKVAVSGRHAREQGFLTSTYSSCMQLCKEVIPILTRTE
jgi:hypothetical protein